MRFVIRSRENNEGRIHNSKGLLVFGWGKGYKIVVNKQRNWKTQNVDIIETPL